MGCHQKEAECWPATWSEARRCTPEMHAAVHGTACPARHAELPRRPRCLATRAQSRRQRIWSFTGTMANCDAPDASSPAEQEVVLNRQTPSSRWSFVAP